MGFPQQPQQQLLSHSPFAFMQVLSPTYFNFGFVQEPSNSPLPTRRKASRIASKQQQAESRGGKKCCLQWLVAVETKHVLSVYWDVSLLHFKHLHSVLATAATRQQLAPHLLWNSL